MVNSQIKKISISMALLFSCNTGSVLAAYAEENSGQAIIVNSIDHPGQYVKLRPFKANRMLPTRSQLNASLQEQKAKLDEQRESTSKLTGSVSAFGNFNTDETVAKKNSVDTSCTRHKNRTISQPFVHKTIEPQTTRFCMPPVEKAQTIHRVQDFAFLRSAEHQLDTLENQPSSGKSLSTVTPSAPVYGQPTPIYEHFNNNSSALSITPVTAAPDQNNLPDFGSAGPPPFPLSLLPPMALKQLIKTLAAGSAAHAPHRQPSYFASWHHNLALTPAVYQNNYAISRSYAGQLPTSGFHSYLQLAYMHRSNHYRAPHTVLSSYSHRNNKQYRTELPTSAQVASYPSYSMQTIPVSHFSQ